MELKFTVGDVVAAFKSLAGIAKGGNVLPILDHVHIRVDAAGVMATASDVTQSLTMPLAAEADGEGVFTVPARRMASILRTLPQDGAARLAAGEDMAVLTAGRSRFQLRTLSAADYPLIAPLEQYTQVTMRADALGEMVERTHFAAGVNDVRYYLNGILLRVTGQYMMAVATDGHRMARCSAPLDPDAVDWRAPDQQSTQVIIPRDALSVLRRLTGGGGHVSVRLTDKHAAFRAGESTLVTKLIDGRFPDFERVIPDHDTHLTTRTATLQQALGRMKLIAGQGIKMSINAYKIRFFSRDGEAGDEGEDAVPCEADVAVDIGLNPGYLMDALSAVGGDTVHLYYGEAGQAMAVINPEDGAYLGVVMPMRL